jgi:hypothetical protein
MPQRVQAYTVTGVGEFPMDMLRYDASWPSRGEDVTAITRSLTHRRRGAYGVADKYTVRLNSLRAPTEARWYSFGWTVGYDR